MVNALKQLLTLFQRSSPFVLRLGLSRLARSTKVNNYRYCEGRFRESSRLLRNCAWECAWDYERARARHVEGCEGRSQDCSCLNYKTAICDDLLWLRGAFWVIASINMTQWEKSRCWGVVGDCLSQLSPQDLSRDFQFNEPFFKHPWVSIKLPYMYLVCSDQPILLAIVSKFVGVGHFLCAPKQFVISKGNKTRYLWDMSMSTSVHCRAPSS